MKIPRVPTPDGISGRQWESGTNGKGSARRPGGAVSDKTADLPRNSTPGHTKVVYKDGVRTEYVNGVVKSRTDMKTGKSI